MAFGDASITPHPNFCPFSTKSSSSSLSECPVTGNQKKSKLALRGTLEPLTEQDHHLSTLLSQLQVIPTHRTDPLDISFNWNDALSGATETGDLPYFIVAFRSKRKSDADTFALMEADRLAHEEAKSKGGLLSYWYTTLDDQRQCLAMCVWKSRDWAVLATDGPLHAQAMRLTSRMYEHYTLERYWLHIRKTEDGSTKVEIETI
ncbi:hypothetical protein SmJEL517_g04600 [Synchytrium microbalum]|uniref:ABM domain-containing protein n=1 Tax=Synchytrium microbalum TaxID=1806994 RepID=A0A507C3X1_9FUNG|nr:uncharacterized protein SmJEL517_g04600 [Synchytrium microbalum]TPX32265.1 hypothetical protein SmJEL517_g04600 [Synchytrium microbalum]